MFLHGNMGFGFHSYYPKPDTHDPFSLINNRKKPWRFLSAVLKALTWSRSRYPLEKKHFSTLVVTTVGLEGFAKNILFKSSNFSIYFIFHCLEREQTLPDVLAWGNECCWTWDWDQILDPKDDDFFWMFVFTLQHVDTSRNVHTYSIFSATHICTEMRGIIAIKS